MSRTRYTSHLNERRVSQGVSECVCKWVKHFAPTPERFFCPIIFEKKKSENSKSTCNLLRRPKVTSTTRPRAAQCYSVAKFHGNGNNIFLRQSVHKLYYNLTVFCFFSEKKYAISSTFLAFKRNFT